MSSVDRERILRHPDLAKRLTEPPLDYARPEQWTGYIPAPIYGGQLNTCSRRAALMDLASEAFRRESNPALEQDSDAPAC